MIFSHSDKQFMPYFNWLLYYFMKEIKAILVIRNVCFQETNKRHMGHITHMSSDVLTKVYWKLEPTVKLESLL